MSFSFDLRRKPCLGQICHICKNFLLKDTSFHILTISHLLTREPVAINHVECDFLASVNTDSVVSLLVVLSGHGQSSEGAASNLASTSMKRALLTEIVCFFLKWCLILKASE